MISDIRCKEIFLSLRMHFTSEYDYHKYNGRMRKQPNSARYEFAALAKKLNTSENVKEFFLSNIVKKFQENNNIITYIGDYYNEESFINFLHWKGMKQTLGYSIKTRYKNKQDILNDFRKGINLPKIIEDYQKGIIPIEIVTSLCYCYPSILDTWEEKYKSDLLISEIIFFIRRYMLLMESFFKIDKIKDIVKNLQ